MATHLQRQLSWAGVGEGDQVDVLDVRERSATWKFVAYVTNLETAAEWIEVVGGKTGEQRRRSFRPEQLYPFRSIRAGVPTAPSLCDAPRLPL